MKVKSFREFTEEHLNIVARDVHMQLDDIVAHPLLAVGRQRVVQHC